MEFSEAAAALKQQIVQDATNLREYCFAVNRLRYFKGTKLEEANTLLLLEHGFKDGTTLFKSYFDDIRPKHKGKAMLTELRRCIKTGEFEAFHDLPEFQTGMWFIDQPLGKSGYPDKLLILWGRVVVLEEKSSECTGFRFNNTCPHPKSFYVFSDARHGMTRIVLAGHFINLEQYSVIIEALGAGEAAHKVARKEILDVHDMEKFFIQPYSRPQFGTAGGYEKTDFIKRSDDNNWDQETVTALLYQLFKGVDTYLEHK